MSRSHCISSDAIYQKVLAHLQPYMTSRPCFKSLRNSLTSNAAVFSLQEKLAKSIHYLISKEDQVRTQITELEQLISQTEVRQLTHAAASQASLFT